MQLTGIHHLTAITADAAGNNRFYTEIMGLRRVKKTVNQDDTSAYHLFFADGAGTAGTDITFFDWPTEREQRGTNAITQTGLRIAESSLDFWAARLRDHGVDADAITMLDGRAGISLRDPEGQRLRLIAAPKPLGETWDHSTVPAEHQVQGLGPVTISVPELAPTETALTQITHMRRLRDYPSPDGQGQVHVFGMGQQGAAAEFHVAVQPDLPRARQGAGGAHHVAFRVPDAVALTGWARHINSFRVPNSGEVDRFYFRSFYFREPGGVLIELATDGPGFDVDEPREVMGQSLSLPPFLEHKRDAITARLKPLD
ncbi:ring-cleaving dioxygenase [Paracoccus sp. (in: a-proteobacteria)]|uniref:ring-cleaving dioxygenase n=1 Tax=Paracoccus sp. TaxID=267 RepID=UPI0026E0D771|nr:ring-cleaving dioxygenase [Paracoccus sp. (in: a-proteobacteria)]MDO5647780.1 ring-cleaving dioxygenase [Paracoccus sp. (in: a-proteobacteria)]